MQIPGRIVAEITRNWTGHESDDISPLISTRFEQVIRVNAERGYELESWKIQSVFVPSIEGKRGTIRETIIAVFVEV